MKRYMYIVHMVFVPDKYRCSAQSRRGSGFIQIYRLCLGWCTSYMSHVLYRSTSLLYKPLYKIISQKSHQTKVWATSMSQHAATRFWLHQNVATLVGLLHYVM